MGYLSPTLAVRDMKKTIEFYKNSLGFKMGMCFPDANNPEYADFSKDEMVQRLVDGVPDKIAGESVIKVDDYDGVKYHLADDSWLLIRPSGTEPVLRIYAEAGSEAAVDEMIQRGLELAKVDK